jgi:hypothetical protein
MLLPSPDRHVVQRHIFHPILTETLGVWFFVFLRIETPYFLKSIPYTMLLQKRYGKNIWKTKSNASLRCRLVVKLALTCINRKNG